ncbi:hypothetical protein [Mesorhizobium sp. M1121]|uniref:hypothetical protein n=1 Tax=Mesorhizobium sp. M1121 TaxID=2957058 RepID=UPI003336CA71
MPFSQLLASKRRSEVDVLFADQFKGEFANAIDDAIVGTPAARLVLARLTDTQFLEVPGRSGCRPEGGEYVKSWSTLYQPSG